MAAATIMYDDLTGVALILNDDETTELMTVAINGHEILIPQEAHSELYQVADRLQQMMRAIKEASIEKGAMRGITHTQAHGEFNEAVFRFIGGIEKFG